MKTARGVASAAVRMHRATPAGVRPELAERRARLLEELLEGLEAVVVVQDIMMVQSLLFQLNKVVAQM